MSCLRLPTLSLTLGLALASPCSEAACPSAADTQTLTRVFEERLSRGEVERDHELFTADFAINAGARKASLKEDQDAVKGWKSAFPDLQARVLDLVCAGDRAAVRWQVRGTNSGTGNGLPATGKSIEVNGMSVFRLVDGRIAESWGMFDRYAMFQQLGLVQLNLGGTR